MNLCLVTGRNESGLAVTKNSKWHKKTSCISHFKHCKQLLSQSNGNLKLIAREINALHSRIQIALFNRCQNWKLKRPLETSLEDAVMCCAEL